MRQLLGVRHSHPDVTRIVLTGHATVDTAVRAINEGAVFKFFIKPCREFDLAMAVRLALEQRQQSRRAGFRGSPRVTAIPACQGTVASVAVAARAECRAIAGNAGRGWTWGCACREATSNCACGLRQVNA